MKLHLLWLALLTSAPALGFDVDESLRRDGTRKNILGSTGARLFCERVTPGVGLRGHFCYVHHSELRDPLRLDGLDLPATSTTWYPSHLAVEYAQGDLTVSEVKFITDDDVFVDRLTLANAGPAPLRLDLRLSSGFAGEPRRGGSTYRAVPLGAAARVDLAGEGALLPGPAAPLYWWIEAETPAEQRGSRDEDRKAAASGGRVLGSDFGGGADHFAAYDVRLPELADATLWLRVARADSPGADGPAPWRVRLDDQPVGTAEVPRTGGWGEEARHYTWVAVPLGAVPDGRHRLRLGSTRAENNTNVDGLLIARGGLDPAALGLAGTIPAVGWDRPAARPGSLSVDGVRFEIGERALVPTGEVLLPAAGGDRLHLLVAWVGDVRPGPALRAGDTPIGPQRAGNLQAPSVVTLPAGELLLRPGEGPATAVILAATAETQPPGGAVPQLRGEGEFHGVAGRGVVVADGFAEGPDATLSRAVTVPAGGSTTLTVACAVAESEPEAERRATSWAREPDPLARQRTEYQAWFDDNCPTFESSDPLMDRLWVYRWYVARHCLSRARTGNLPEPCFFEGMHGGWYPSQIDYSSPHIIDETRWLRDPVYAFGQGTNHVLAPNENGVFESLRTNWRGSWYTHWIGAAMWGAYQVHPDAGWLARVADGIAADVRGHFQQFDRDGDWLCTPPSHWPTGMEWQPAFFFFNNYDNTEPEAPLERGDLVAYVFANARAAAEAYAELGLEAQSAEMAAIAERVREACLRKLWSPADRWFYANHETWDIPALCMEIVGVYPVSFGLPPDEGDYTEALGYLFDERYFDNPFPAATVAKTCPVYTPAQQQWPGPGGAVTGCMWNGPTWPHANSLVANALANALRDYATNRQVTPERYWRFLGQWTRLHFEGGDIGAPNIQEYYHGETGVGWGCDDYFHSTWCDLVIRQVAGLRPSAGDELALEPIPGPLTHFLLDRVRYHGRELTVCWNGDGYYADRPRGFSVSVDGRQVARRAELGPLRARLTRR